MYSKFDDIFSGKSSVDEAFAEMTAESNKLLARFAATYK
jgi:sn-glycerol 3-phosphate transport system substrate-binding protein